MEIWWGSGGTAVEEAIWIWSLQFGEVKKEEVIGRVRHHTGAMGEVGAALLGGRREIELPHAWTTPELLPLGRWSVGSEGVGVCLYTRGGKICFMNC